MRIVLTVGAIISVFLGASILGNAKSAIHEIEAFVLFLIGAVLFSAGAIIGAIERADDVARRQTWAGRSSHRSEDVLWEPSKAKTPPAMDAEIVSPPPDSPEPLVFHCTACGAKLRAAADDAGKRAKCPTCGAVCVVRGRSPQTDTRAASERLKRDVEELL
ncbi:MAG: hypothetical protein ABIF82_06230 [Planctomycetota bacterium]